LRNVLEKEVVLSDNHAVFLCVCLCLSPFRPICHINTTLCAIFMSSEFTSSFKTRFPPLPQIGIATSQKYSLAAF